MKNEPSKNKIQKTGNTWSMINGSCFVSRGFAPSLKDGNAHGFSFFIIPLLFFRRSENDHFLSSAQQKPLPSSSAGFALLQMIIVVVIIAVISTVVVYNLSAYRTSQALKNAEDDIASLLGQARAQTLSSQNSSQYGVHLQSTKAALFTGAAYSSGASTNKEIIFDTAVTLASISLSGGGADVVFNRLTGETSQYGTATVQLVSDSTKTKTITISKTGLISGN